MTISNDYICSRNYSQYSRCCINNCADIIFYKFDWSFVFGKPWTSSEVLKYPLREKTVLWYRLDFGKFWKLFGRWYIKDGPSRRCLHEFLQAARSPRRPRSVAPTARGTNYSPLFFTFKDHHLHWRMSSFGEGDKHQEQVASAACRQQRQSLLYGCWRPQALLPSSHVVSRRCYLRDAGTPTPLPHFTHIYQNITRTIIKSPLADLTLQSIRGYRSGLRLGGLFYVIPVAFSPTQLV